MDRYDWGVWNREWIEEKLVVITPVFAENLRSQSGVHAYFMWIAGQGTAGYSATFRS